jgi:hypothetical protein
VEVGPLAVVFALAAVDLLVEVLPTAEVFGLVFESWWAQWWKYMWAGVSP